MRLAQLIAATGVLLGLAGCGKGADGDGRAFSVDATTPTGVHAIASDARLGLEGLALAGDAALLARYAKGALTVTRLVLRDGATSTILRVHHGSTVLSMHASASIAGLTVTDADDEQGGPRSGLYVGPPTGPLRLRIPIRDDGWIPRSVRADGDRLYVLEVRGQKERILAFDVTGRSRLTRLRSLTIRAGFEARTQPLSACPGHRRGRLRPGAGRGTALARACLTVQRIGGARVTVAPISGDATAVSPSGNAVVSESRDGVVEVRRGGRARRLQANDQPPPWPGRGGYYAGERVLLTHIDRAFGPEQMLLAAPGQRPRRFGVPSETLGGVSTDARRVLWAANECVLVADVRAPAATAPPEGPCPRTEIALDTDDNPDRLRLRADDRVPVRLECIAAPPPGCRGTMRLTSRLGAAEPQEFVVAPGRTRHLAVRLPSRLAAIVRAASHGAAFDVDVVARDPNGRKTRWPAAVRLFG